MLNLDNKGSNLPSLVHVVLIEWFSYF